MVYNGGCHCGNLSIEFETEIAPADMEVRTCQCTFCRKHNSTAAADPAGYLVIRVRDRHLVSRYAFGPRTAEYLVCRTCGVYVAAMTASDDDRRAIVIVNCLDQRSLFSRTPLPVDYDAESREGRLERRRQRWMPVTIEGLG